MAMPVGAAVILFSIVLIDRAIPKYWVGRADILLQFRVSDRITGVTISDASVLLTHFTGKKIKLRTDQFGLAIIDLELRAGGRSSLAGRSRSVDYGEWEIQVEVDGFLVNKSPLEKYTKTRIYHENNNPPEIPIRMIPKSSGKSVALVVLDQ